MFLEIIRTVDVTGPGIENLCINALEKLVHEYAHVVGQGDDGIASIRFIR